MSQVALLYTSGKLSRRCLNDKDSFCYTCGEFAFRENRKTIGEFYMKARYTYFKINLGNQDKTWAPHIICKSCKESLRLWTTGNRAALKFGIPMIWCEPSQSFWWLLFLHDELSWICKKNRENIPYLSISLATRPIPHSDENPVPVFKKLLDIPISAASLAPELVPEELTERDSNPESLDNDNDTDHHECSSDPNRFNQDYLSDLIRDLNLPKETAELLASHLKDRNILQTKTNVTFYRNREGNFLPYFKQYEEIVVCNDVELLLMELGIVHYEANSWRLFIDSSKWNVCCYTTQMNTLQFQ